ncbi:hypothetical protein RSPO_m01527 (plasmid) [Ralstonia solanacearum Po82]|uniref:Uncharacterized protein n=1 Tax=Ralstonia solanacearum (strain Po82) TaxID=1031711 RepID=F6GBM2_RALS8|nr:hypothetical protein RSPO_m01527 [Ralstonia solanacearum Po82]
MRALVYERLPPSIKHADHEVNALARSTRPDSARAVVPRRKAVELT